MRKQWRLSFNSAQSHVFSHVTLILLNTPSLLAAMTVYFDLHLIHAIQVFQYLISIPVLWCLKQEAKYKDKQLYYHPKSNILFLISCWSNSARAGLNGDLCKENWKQTNIYNVKNKYNQQIENMAINFPVHFQLYNTIQYNTIQYNTLLYGWLISRTVVGQFQVRK